MMFKIGDKVRLKRTAITKFNSYYLDEVLTVTDSDEVYFLTKEKSVQFSVSNYEIVNLEYGLDRILKDEKKI